MTSFNLTVSIVSHGHGEMVEGLVKSLLGCAEISQIIVTLNIPELVLFTENSRLTIVKNEKPKGFGANHNAAFAVSSGRYFCILNPDIELANGRSPFSELIKTLQDEDAGMVAPLVTNQTGATEDSMRYFLTPISLLRRVVGLRSGIYLNNRRASVLEPDWVAGMFMLFRAEAYAKVQGFDERYFMYCEDADICTRLWKARYKVVGCLSTSVIHNAQRASHRNFKHLFWHMASMARYFLNHSFSLPQKNVIKQDG